MGIPYKLSFLVAVAVIFQICDACRTGYTSFEDSCYHLSHDMENWIDAMTLCRSVGGHLAEIDSANENNFLKNMVTTHAIGNAWIGANDIDVEGRWVWWNTDRTFTYSNWSPGEPNDSRHEEDCLLLSSAGVWNDGKCSYLAEYICEIPDNGETIIG